MRARTGRNDYIARCLFKYADRVFNDGSRLRAQARVEGRLSATGLVAGEVHVNAEAVENVHDCLTSLRVERIDEAGDEELNVSHELIVIRYCCHCEERTIVSDEAINPLIALEIASWREAPLAMTDLCYGMIINYEYISNPTA